MAHPLSAYPVPLVTVDGVSGDVVLRDTTHEATIYTQRTNGWVLNNSGNSIAKCDELGRIFTRSYKIGLSITGPYAVAKAPECIVHELGYLIMLQLRGFNDTATVNEIITSAPLPVSLRPRHDITGPLIAMDNTALVHGRYALSSAGVLTFYVDVSTKFTATGKAGYEDTVITFDRRV